MNERHGYSAESAVFCAVMQWLMLVVTFVVMVALQRLARGAPVEAQATLALGTLVLFAHVLGTVARRFRIPRMVAYLVAGLLAGPSVRELVSSDALDKLSPITNGALFLIAFAVGNALTVDVLRGARRTTLLRLAAGAMVLPFLAVVLVVLTVSPWFPLTAHQPLRDAVVVALALGTVAVVSSPILIWPVMRDAGAGGGGGGGGDRQLPQTTLEVSVLQDLAAVLLVVLVLALARPLGSPGAVTPGSAIHTLALLGGSIVAGVTLAAVSTQYLRVVRQRLVWVLVVLAFIVSQLVRLLVLDAVLVGLAAGVALRAMAPEHSARVRSELERCEIPVYVVFFSLAGASLQLDALGDVWPWVLLLIGLRIVGIWGGMRWAAGGRRGHPAVGGVWRDYGWLGFVSQGGFAVTLAAVFRRAFPEWNVSLEALVLAMIGAQQLVGPICFEWVLRGGRWERLTQWLPWSDREVHDRSTLGTNETATGGDAAVLLPGGGGGGGGGVQ
jgi:Kef-type K+ transport system membrane component KefB